MKRNTFQNYRQNSLIQEKTPIPQRKLSDPVRGNTKESPAKLLIQLIRQTPSLDRRNSLDIIKQKIEDIDTCNVSPKQLSPRELYDSIQKNIITPNVIYSLSKQLSSGSELSDTLRSSLRLRERNLVRRQSVLTANWLSQFEALEFILESKSPKIASQLIPRRCMSENALDLIDKGMPVKFKENKSNGDTENALAFAQLNNSNGFGKGRVVVCNNHYDTKKRVSFSAPSSSNIRHQALGRNSIKKVKPIVKKSVGISDYEYTPIDYDTFKAWRRGSRMSTITKQKSPVFKKKKNAGIKIVCCSERFEKYEVKEPSIESDFAEEKIIATKMNPNSFPKSSLNYIKLLFARGIQNCFQK
uniref:Uncharacterized protein n=1 Tax=Rhabditophanes sp. KR3021 TaxID=114890 RepID=A0AC35TSA5_9BILA